MAQDTSSSLSGVWLLLLLLSVVSGCCCRFEGREDGGRHVLTRHRDGGVESGGGSVLTLLLPLPFKLVVEGVRVGVVVGASWDLGKKSVVQVSSGNMFRHVMKWSVRCSQRYIKTHFFSVLFSLCLYI